MNSVEIITPCYNPPLGWDNIYINAVDTVKSIFPAAVDYRWTIVNDGSTTDLEPGIDKIRATVPGLQYFSYTVNRGKGYAIRYAVERSNSELIVYTDIDFPFSGNSLVGIIDALTQLKYDVVLGRRSANYFKSIPWRRSMISRTLILFNRWLLGLGFPDTQCGLKGFNKRAKLYFLMVTTDGFLFEIEFIKLLQKAPDIALGSIEVELKDNIKLSKVSLRGLLRQLKIYRSLMTEKRAKL